MSRTGYTRRWRTVVTPSPAAGADFTLRAPGSSWWRVVSLVARLVTDATVANRTPNFSATDGTSTWWTQVANVVQAASGTVDYCLFAGADFAGNVGGFATSPLPNAGLLLAPGHSLTVVTANLQAGDQWSRIVARLDEVPSDVPYVGDNGQVYGDDIGG